MRKKLGIICMLIGALMVCGAAGLLGYNQMEQNEAAQESAALLRDLRQFIDEPYSQQAQEAQDSQAGQPVSQEEESSGIITVNGLACIGYISIPALGIELPVTEGWDEESLRRAPCRYYGSAEDGNLVLAAHNYPVHFGNLYKLKDGDEVIFTSTENKRYFYQVREVTYLNPEDVEKMIDSSYDLTMYTCTYDAVHRVTVRCQRVQASDLMQQSQSSNEGNTV